MATQKTIYTPTADECRILLKSLDLLRQSRVRQLAKELPGSSIHDLISDDIRDLDALSAKLR